MTQEAPVATAEERAAMNINPSDSVHHRCVEIVRPWLALMSRRYPTATKYLIELLEGEPAIEDLRVENAYKDGLAAGVAAERERAAQNVTNPANRRRKALP